MKLVTVYRSKDETKTVFSSAEALAAAQAEPENEGLKEWREVLQIIAGE